MSGRAEPSVRSIGTDPVAFTEFYRAHVDEVTRFVARRVADPQLVADLTAEVFLAVIEAAARYRGSHGGPRTWLYGIARNVIAAEFRRSAREQRAESLIAGRRLLDADDVDRLMERIDAFRQVRELHEVLRAWCARSATGQPSRTRPGTWSARSSPSARPMRDTASPRR